VCWANIATGDTNKISSSTRAVERRRIMMGLLERSRLGVIIIVREEGLTQRRKGRRKAPKKGGLIFATLRLPLRLCAKYYPAVVREGRVAGGLTIGSGVSFDL